jgi:hypothetical protein
MAAGMAQARAMRDVPDENVALIARYRTRMEALGRK